MRYLLTYSEITEPFSYLNCQEMLNRVKFPLVDRFTDKRRSNIWWPIRKIHTTKPKKENQSQNRNTDPKTETQKPESQNTK